MEADDLCGDGERWGERGDDWPWEKAFDPGGDFAGFFAEFGGPMSSAGET